MNGEDWIYNPALRARIGGNLAAYQRLKDAPEGLKRAAVSIVLTPARDHRGTALLLTRRTPRLNAHSGQYALPGGRVDPGESGPGQVLGKLDNLPTRSGYLITPFVVWLDGHAELRPSPHEIAAVFRIPLNDLFAGRGRGGNREEARGAEGEAGIFSLFIPTLGHDLFAQHHVGEEQVVVDHHHVGGERAAARLHN